jgi:stearoyl-CoA desaturase (delta-9 desaturase)
MCFAVPTFIPWYFWGEDLWRAYFVCGFLRYVASLHSTWCVNSVAHLFGNKPYDRFINPVENLFVTICAIGEGFHNFHHTFPQDYSTSELGMRFNVTTMLLDLMALIGQVYERKKMPPQLVQQRMRRTGDGTVGFGYAKLEPQPQPQTVDKTE